jgi:hypothetical protein
MACGVERLKRRSSADMTSSVAGTSEKSKKKRLCTLLDTVAATEYDKPLIQITFNAHAVHVLDNLCIRH